MTRGPFLVGGLVLAGLAAGSLAPSLGPETNPPTRVTGMEAHETQAGASLLGQFRTTAAAWMYLRADLYLHNGVEMRALTDAERRSGHHGVGGGEDAHHNSDKLHDDSSIVTVVPDKDEDFRGIFGDIERGTAAYRDMKGHDHNDPSTVLPLFRLTTWVDPSFITGWCLGAMVIARAEDKGAVDRAIAYLQEGRRANPDSIEIVTQIGTLNVARKADIAEGLKWLEQARSIARRQDKKTTLSEAEAAVETYRWLALVYKHQKRTKEQHAAAAEGLAWVPDDKVLKRLAK
ncbi:MAG: tetratricopeptide repeat protein [Fimbriimonas sp.]